MQLLGPALATKHAPQVAPPASWRGHNIRVRLVQQQDVASQRKEADDAHCQARQEKRPAEHANFE